MTESFQDVELGTRPPVSNVSVFVVTERNRLAVRKFASKRIEILQSIGRYIQCNALQEM